MYGVVSLLDEKHNSLVESIWAEFHDKFDIHGVSVTPVAHFSYHVAPEYDMEMLTQKLETIARSTKPFTVNTNGLGIFTGDDLVLYIPVQLSPKIVSLNQQLWDALADVAHKPAQYYRPGKWQPHITLTHRDVDHDLLPKIIRLLSQRDFYWEITVNNLTILGNEPDGVISRITF
jgi:2'-5' RNA ligase